MSMFFWYCLVCADVFCKNVTADPRPAEIMDQHELLIQSKYSNLYQFGRDYMPEK